MVVKWAGRFGLCQICKSHRPGGWRWCPHCKRWCGSGCKPERCWHGDQDDICNECFQADAQRQRDRTHTTTLLPCVNMGDPNVGLDDAILLIITDFFWTDSMYSMCKECEAERRPRQWRSIFGKYLLLHPKFLKFRWRLPNYLMLEAPFELLSSSY